MDTATTTIGNAGTITLPAEIRARMSLREGSVLELEIRADGLLLRPQSANDVEQYTPERKAEFLLNNALDEQDYLAACAAVRQMGLDPDAIAHERSIPR